MEDDEPGNDYEEERRTRIARNKEALKAAGLSMPTNIMATISATRKKNTSQASIDRHISTRNARQEPPQLRKRAFSNNQRSNDGDDQARPQHRRCSRINNQEGDINEDANYDVCDEDLQMHDDANETLNAEPNTKHKGRGHTVKHDIWMRKNNEPKLHVDYNEKKQPIGAQATPLPNFISTIVRSGIALSSTNWFEVDEQKKLDLWDIVQMFFDVTDNLHEWVMKQAAMRWRNFKCEIKRLYFSPNQDLADDQLFEIKIDKRVPKSDWIWLVRHGRTPQSEALTESGKANSAKMTLNHTTGSKSFARVADEWFKENGYEPARHEVFIQAYTRKDGNTQGQARDMIEMRCQSYESGARSIANETRIPHLEIMRKKIATQAHNDIPNNSFAGGKPVILLSVVGQRVPVAKATVQRTSRSDIVGGTALGLQYCEVVVDYVLKKNAPLRRPYKNVTTMGDAQGHCIAWPYERMEDDFGVTSGGGSTADGGRRS